MQTTNYMKFTIQKVLTNYLSKLNYIDNTEYIQIKSHTVTPLVTESLLLYITRRAVTFINNNITARNIWCGFEEYSRKMLGVFFFFRVQCVCDFLQYPSTTKTPRWISAIVARRQSGWKASSCKRAFRLSRPCYSSMSMWRTHLCQ